jgi:hypothetical protein
MAACVHVCMCMWVHVCVLCVWVHLCDVYVSACMCACVYLWACLRELSFVQCHACVLPAGRSPKFRPDEGLTITREGFAASLTGWPGLPYLYGFVFSLFKRLHCLYVQSWRPLSMCPTHLCPCVTHTLIHVSYTPLSMRVSNPPLSMCPTHLCTCVIHTFCTELFTVRT